MNIYREEILEHWQNPQNWGVLKNFDLESDAINPLCGDKIKVQIKLDHKASAHVPSEARRAINDIRFTGNGCAISVAAASILSEFVKGKTLKDIDKITGKDVLNLIGADSSFPPARLKCAFLALEAIKKLASS